RSIELQPHLEHKLQCLDDGVVVFLRAIVHRAPSPSESEQGGSIVVSGGGAQGQVSGGDAVGG
ncbi:MAG: hypothetical protein ACR2RE_27405, partial [Geminicoccaceae bacterium]